MFYLEFTIKHMFYLEFTIKQASVLIETSHQKRWKDDGVTINCSATAIWKFLSVSMFARLLREFVTVACWSPKVTISIIDYIS